MSLWELTSVNIWPSPIRHGTRTQYARTQHEEYYCVWGDIFFWRAKWGGDHPNVLQYKALQLTTQYVHIDFRNPIANDVWWWASLSHTHCEGWRCGWRHDIRITIANDDSAACLPACQLLNVVAKLPCLRPHGGRQVRSGCVSGTSGIIYNPQPLYNSTLSITPPFALRETVFCLWQVFYVTNFVNAPISYG